MTRNLCCTTLAIRSICSDGQVASRNQSMSAESSQVSSLSMCPTAVLINPQPSIVPHFPPQGDDAIVPTSSTSRRASPFTQAAASPVIVKRPRGRPRGRGKGRAPAHNWSRISASAPDGDVPDDHEDNDYRSLSRKPLPEPRPDSGSELHTKSGRKVVKPSHLVPATVPTSRCSKLGSRKS